jgi:hypothetical protein
MTTAHSEGHIPELTLGARIYLALRQAKIGVNEMADELGVTRQALGRWIADGNKRGVPTLYLKTIALRCGVPYEWLKDGLSPTTRRKAGDSRGRTGAVAAAAAA